jgi:sialate O-acetylesterase
MPVAAWAAPVLPHFISDHVVFQRDREVPVWGTADPDEKITVTLASHASMTTAGSDGKWSVRLPAMSAGGPFVLRVSGDKTIEFKDVMIGEVWIASGQSNMTFELAGSAGAEDELPKADYPEIRLFTVPRRVALSPQADTLPASWQPCSPESAKNFSAVAYYFARDLYKRLHVPIGIVESAWPGTAIEEWISPEEAARSPQVQSSLDAWNKREGASYKTGRAHFSLEFDDFELVPVPGNTAQAIKLADFDDGLAKTSWGGTWTYSYSETPESTFQLASPGRDGKGFSAHVDGAVDATDGALLKVRYRADGSPVDLSEYSAVRFWVRGNGQFRFRSLQPSIADWDDYSTPVKSASTDWTEVVINFRDLRQDGWGVVRGFTSNALSGFSIECLPRTGYPPRPAAGLYQGMTAPLVKAAFRGVIWYQGESNGWRPKKYRELLPALIESWRAASNQSEMQFLIVQLPNHGAIPTEPGDSAWAELREAQLHTAKTIPGTGLAVTIDVGDPKDLHPHRKAEVGERLALSALGTVYHQDVVPSGPLYDSMNIEGPAIRVRFKYADGGLRAQGGEVRGFAVAGSDKKFHWASARIEGNAVVVSSPDVPAPVAVRYGWADSPECTLFNAVNLPASPFRTDNW